MKMCSCSIVDLCRLLNVRKHYKSLVQILNFLYYLFKPSYSPSMQMRERILMSVVSAGVGNIDNLETSTDEYY